jgi:transcription-repair coupling factor (superfamily II helicase)
VLVSTTIVESGLDIPNANTLIVENADVFGLSQLHQLRGRVGRGRERAYSYFLHPADKPLNETAHERLNTIAQHTDLGAGIQVAMKDLEIRGSGNLLGGEQSGQIAEIGFDLYVRLVGEALSEFKGEVETTVSDLKIEMPLDAHIPHNYVPAERLRLEMYKRIADAHSTSDLAAVQSELEDRYGKIPIQVQNLLEVSEIRMAAQPLGLKEMVVAGPSVRFAPVELPDSVQVRLARLYPQSTIKLASRTVLIPRPKPKTLGRGEISDRELLDWIWTVLSAISGQPLAPSVKE